MNVSIGFLLATRTEDGLYRESKMAVTVNRFSLSRQDLKVLMSKRKEEAVTAVEKYEGVESIASQLETSLKGGLSGAPQDLEARRAFYGANVLPHNPPKSFLSLCVDAIQDPTLIILIGAAIISIALGVGVEERKVSLAVVYHLMCILDVEKQLNWDLNRLFTYAYCMCVCVCVCFRR